MDWAVIAGVLGGIVLITNAAVALYKWTDHMTPGEDIPSDESWIG